MFAQANAELLARVEGAGESGSAREQLLRLSRVVLDFAVEDPARQQLLFTRSIPGFAPSAQSYALAEQLVQRTSRLLAELGCGSPQQADVYTALIAGLSAQQIAEALHQVGLRVEAQPVPSRGFGHPVEVRRCVGWEEHGELLEVLLEPGG